jgi:hypothetical protein
MIAQEMFSITKEAKDRARLIIGLVRKFLRFFEKYRTAL